jgi:hypothetical protein
MTTPQFQRRTHRARDRMLDLGRRIPDIWSLIDRVRVANGDDIGSADWPAHVYLPLEHAGFIAANIMRMHGETPTPTTAAWAATELCTLSAWRMTQGIYRYDPALYAALVDTPLAGDIPASIIQRMPEWCVYIETPEMVVATTSGDAPLHGVFAWLDHARGADHDILVLALDVDGLRLTPTHVPLVGSLDDAVAATLAEWQDAYARGNAESPPPAAWADQVRRTVPGILSLLLYLCSEAPDLSRRGKPATPANPEPVRTRRHGWRLFAAGGPSEWDVGVRIGAALRAAYAREQTGGAAAESGRHVRPHVRRAHWHTILSGKRKRDDGTPIPASDQRRELRWMPPIPVALEDVGDLTAVIRPIKGGHEDG